MLKKLITLILFVGINAQTDSLICIDVESADGIIITIDSLENETVLLNKEIKANKDARASSSDLLILKDKKIVMLVRHKAKYRSYAIKVDNENKVLKMWLYILPPLAFIIGISL